MAQTAAVRSERRHDPFQLGSPLGNLALELLHPTARRTDLVLLCHPVTLQLLQFSELARQRVLVRPCAMLTLFEVSALRVVRLHPLERGVQLPVFDSIPSLAQERSELVEKTGPRERRILNAAFSNDVTRLRQRDIVMDGTDRALELRYLRSDLIFVNDWSRRNGCGSGGCDDELLFSSRFVERFQAFFQLRRGERKL
jgi:hypothetical protein